MMLVWSLGVVPECRCHYSSNSIHVNCSVSIIGRTTKPHLSWKRLSFCWLTVNQQLFIQPARLRLDSSQCTLVWSMWSWWLAMVTTPYSSTTYLLVPIAICSIAVAGLNCYHMWPLIIRRSWCSAVSTGLSDLVSYCTGFFNSQENIITCPSSRGQPHRVHSDVETLPYWCHATHVKTRMFFYL